MDLLGKFYVHVGLVRGKGDGVVELLLVVGEGVGSDELLVDIDSEGDDSSGLLVVGGEDGSELPVVAGEGGDANSSSLVLRVTASTSSLWVARVSVVTSSSATSVFNSSFLFHFSLHRVHS
jgi:hypothetical protein